MADAYDPNTPVQLSHERFVELVDAPVKLAEMEAAEMSQKGVSPLTIASHLRRAVEASVSLKERLIGRMAAATAQQQQQPPTAAPSQQQTQPPASPTPTAPPTAEEQMQGWLAQNQNASLEKRYMKAAELRLLPGQQQADPMAGKTDISKPFGLKRVR